MSPERSAQIETILLRMAQSGQLRGRVSEEQLIDLLNQVRILLLLRCARADAAQMEEAQGKAGPKKSTIVVRAMRIMRLRFPLTVRRVLCFSIIAERASTMISTFDLVAFLCASKNNKRSVRTSIWNLI